MKKKKKLAGYSSDWGTTVMSFDTPCEGADTCFYLRKSANGMYLLLTIL